MKRFILLCSLAVLAALGLCTSTSRAQSGPSHVTKHFRLIPRLSMLHRTGGIAGVDERYRLRGEYDFRQRLDDQPEARFEHAEIWGRLISDLPGPEIVLDVDETLNLEGLKGESLPVLAPFDVYKFTGETSDGSSVNLFAAILGNWMFVRGGTEPPPEGADYFTDRVQWLARSRPFADLNGDGVVDAADYVAIRDAQTSGAGIGSEEDGTAGVTLADWVQQFGESVPDLTAIDAAISAATSNAPISAAVPEPGALFLAIIAWLTMVNWRPARVEVQ
jgi:hypothetical protein